MKGKIIGFLKNMWNNHRKGSIIALVIAALFIIGSFGGDEKDAKTEKAANKSVTEQTETTTEESVERTLPVFDEEEETTKETTEPSKTESTTEKTTTTKSTTNAITKSTTKPTAKTTTTTKKTTTVPVKSISRHYVANNNTGKIHLDTCSSVNKIKQENREDFNCSRDEMIDKGYSPCGNCNP